jgi:hypothetical protein
LRTLFEGYDKSFETHKYFKNDETYSMLVSDLVEAFRNADQNKIETIASEVELRRVPTTEGYNY